MNTKERQIYINQLRDDIIKIRRRVLDQKYNDKRFNIYKNSNKHLLWLKENGMIKSTFLQSWLSIPQELLDYIENNKENTNVDN